MAKRGKKRKKSFLRRAVGVGVLAGVAYAVWRAIEANREERDSGWEPQPFPFPPQPRIEKPVHVPPGVEVGGGPETEGPAEPLAEGDWVAPNGDACPASHPIKAKVEKGIYHEPGGFNYDATKPDRCYRDAAAAEADGLRKSKR